MELDGRQRLEIIIYLLIIIINEIAYCPLSKIVSEQCILYFSELSILFIINSIIIEKVIFQIHKVLFLYVPRNI